MCGAISSEYASAQPAETLHREESAEVGQVDLHDVDEAAFDEAAHVFHRVRALAGGDRQLRRGIARAR
mgnify:CR=1 FL=1